MIPSPQHIRNNLKSIHKKLVSIFYHLSFSLFCTVYICVCMQTKSGHFGSIPTQVETPCDKLGMTKCPVRLVPKNSKEYKELKPVEEWYNKNRKNPTFKRLLDVAYRNWKELDYINNKVVKKKATSIGASSGPGSAVAGSTRRRVGKCHLGLTNQLIDQLIKHVGARSPSRGGSCTD